MTSRRVLVVDDDRDYAEIFAELLSSLGHQVEVAHDGTTCLVLDERWTPDIIFLDLGLPAMDGYEVARRLRQQRGDTARIIALSGFGQAVDHDRSRTAGCNEHLVKPAALNDILRAMDGDR
ncbi:MAG TPA: response regulator [Kofleriaceae bacterium]|nr:response regulator [Kofleriaceae bacterium]